MEGNQAAYRPKWLAAGLFAVQLLFCQPLALIPDQQTKLRNRGVNFLQKNVVTHALDLTTKYA